jgi:hypothetical protein
MNYLRQLLGAFILALITSVTIASPAEFNYVEGLAKQIDYIEKNQEAVWPGFHPAVTPSIIVLSPDSPEKSIFAYALNFNPGKLPWVSVQTSGAPIYYLNDANALNLSDTGEEEYFADVEGQNAFIYDAQSKNLSVSENYINHFMWKRASYYFAHDARLDPLHADDVNISYNSFNNLTLLKLFYLEDAALTAAQQMDSGRAEEALRDAVAIHQYRSQQINADSRKFENALEVLLGTPFYISWTSKQLNDNDYRKMTQRTGCLPLIGFSGARDMVDCVLSGLPAFASSVYGHALEKKLAGGSWKSKVETQFKSISNQAVEYYQFSNAQAEQIALQAMKKSEYNYDRITRVIEHNISPYLKNMQTVLKNFQLSQGVEMRFSIQYGEVLVFAAKILDGLDGEDYRTDISMSIANDLNIDLEIDENTHEHLILNHLPYLMRKYVFSGFDVGLDFSRSYASIKLTDKAKLLMDGKFITVSKFVRLKKVQSFQSLTIIDSDLRLPILVSGELDARDGVLKITEMSKNIPLAKMKAKLRKMHEAANKKH